MALFVSYEETLKLKLDMNELIELFEEAHRLLGQNKGTYGKRLRVVFPTVTGLGSGRPWTHDMRILPAILPGIGAGLRVGTTKKGDKPGLGTGGFLLIFFDSETMEWKAAISDSLIHGVRSAVPDGMAAKHLSLANSSTLGIIGSGRIAQWATRAICAVRPIKKIKVYSPNPDHRKSFVSLFTKEIRPHRILLSFPHALHSGCAFVLPVSLVLPRGQLTSNGYWGALRSFHGDPL